MRSQPQRPYITRNLQQKRQSTNMAPVTVFRLLTDFVCLYNYEFGLSLCKIVRSSVILLLPLLIYLHNDNFICTFFPYTIFMCVAGCEQTRIYRVSLYFDSVWNNWKTRSCVHNHSVSGFGWSTNHRLWNVYWIGDVKSSVHWHAINKKSCYNRSIYSSWSDAAILGKGKCSWNKYRYHIE